VDLVPRLAELCARENYSIFILGASEQNSARAAENLMAKYPGLRIAGRYSPPLMPLERMNHDDILRRIARARPDILLVAMGNPKQEKWLAMHRDRLNVPVCIGVGGSIDFISGATKRAPHWMRSSGMEWAYRLAQEPKRLAGRYLGDVYGFARYMPQQYLATTLQPRHKTKSGVFADQNGNTSVISIYGDLSGPALKEFRGLARYALDCGMSMVLNLSQTHYIGPDALGALVAVASEVRNSGGQLWLAEMKPHLQRVINGSRLAGLFMTTSSVTDGLHRTARAEERFFHSSHADLLGRAGENSLQIRVELLQDVCRKVSAASNQAAFEPEGTDSDYVLDGLLS
jgi:N-acetylglucosaminyldiphosphoundecaprenol N-acetyl-beta-D-mannosaminyltransferase